MIKNFNLLLCMFCCATIFAQTPVIGPVNNKSEEAKIEIITSSERVVAIDDKYFNEAATASLIKQMGKTKFELVKKYGVQNNYPDCIKALLKNNREENFSDFNLYKIADFYNIKTLEEDWGEWSVVLAGAAENKNAIANCVFNTDFYIIIKSAAIRKKNDDEVTEADKPLINTDTDGDGVMDNEDVCPALVGDKKNKGCPVKSEKIIPVEKKLLPDNFCKFFNSIIANAKDGFNDLAVDAKVLNAPYSFELADNFPGFSEKPTLNLSINYMDVHHNCIDEVRVIEHFEAVKNEIEKCINSLGTNTVEKGQLKNTVWVIPTQKNNAGKNYYTEVILAAVQNTKTLQYFTELFVQKRFVKP